jgi:hypothetical protein
MLLAVVLLGACRSTPEPSPFLEPEPVSGLQIHGLLIFNATRTWISTVQLLVPATGRFVSCGNKAPDATCWTGFAEVEYEGNGIDISWTQAGQSWSTGAFILRPRADVDIGQPAYVRVIITGPDMAGAEIIQDPDNGRR